MTPFTSVPEVLTSIQSSFDPISAANERAIIRFDLAGEGGGSYWLSIADGTCSYGLGEPPGTASVTIACTTEDCLSVLSGTMKSVTAFAQGRLKVTGNIPVAMKLHRWFPTRR
jgi:putative sterol carrier protein